MRAESPPRTSSAQLLGVGIKVLPWLLLVAGLARICLALAFSQTPTGVRLGNDFVDLGVYRMGGQGILHGQSLYELTYVVGDLPFTYPPFAALVFVPFAAVPFGVAQGLMVLLGLASLLMCSWLTAVNLSDTLGSSLPWSTALATAGLFGLGGMLEPTTTTLDLGQVNLILMAAVLFDSLKRWRFTGALIGVAAGIKIVPGVFALAMVPTRRWVEFRNACIAFGATVLLGALVEPQQSWLYWTKLFYSDSRQASVVTILNQSLYSDLVRLFGKPGGLYAWFLVAVIVLALGITLATRIWPGDRLTATVTVAITGLLVSPVSWNHHWVWLMPALATAGALGVRTWRSGRRGVGSFVWIYVALTTFVTALGPIKLANATVGFESSVSNWLVGNSLVAAGVGYVFVVWIARAGRRDPL